MNAICSVMLMTYRQKTRDGIFVFIIFATIIGTYLCNPALSPMQVLVVQGDIFIQGNNPTWIPIVSALGVSLFLPLIGFFYFKTDLLIDHNIGIAQLIGTTPTSKFQYLLGKYLSNILILVQIIGVVVIATFLLLNISYPNTKLEFYTFISPFIANLSMIFLLASLPILFDCIPFLRGMTGSLIFVCYYLYIIIVMQNISSNIYENPINLMIQENNLDKVQFIFLNRFFDISSFSFISRTLGEAVFSQSGNMLDDLRLFTNSASGTLNLNFYGVTFYWIDVLVVTISCIFSVILLALSSLMIGDKFVIKKSRFSKSNSNFIEENFIFNIDKLNFINIKPRINIIYLVINEVIITLKGSLKKWYIMVIGCFVYGYLGDLEMAQRYLPAMIIVLLPPLSKGSCREYLYQTTSIIDSSPLGRKYILIKWSAYFILISIFGSGIMIRTLMVGHILGVYCYFIGVIFLASFSIFTSEYTNRASTFEAIILVLTYLVAIQIDWALYIGIYNKYSSFDRANIYLYISLLSMILVRYKQNILSVFNFSNMFKKKEVIGSGNFRNRT